MDDHNVTYAELNDLCSMFPSLAEFTQLIQKVTSLESEIKELRYSIMEAWTVISEIQQEQQEGEHTPEYIKQIKQKIEWLQQRCEDFDRIFNWNTMVLEGVNK